VRVLRVAPVVVVAVAISLRAVARLRLLAPRMLTLC
jgi:hypothetical protein